MPGAASGDGDVPPAPTSSTERERERLDDEISTAADRLSALLRGLDPTRIDAVLSSVRSRAVPPPTADEAEAHERVESALAAQRAVALLRTEARLHSTAAERCESVASRLEKTRAELERRARRAERAASSRGGSGGTAKDDEAGSSEQGEALERFRRSVLGPIAAEATRRSAMARRAADGASRKEREFVQLRREANSSVSVIMRRTESRYNEAFAEALRSAEGVRSAERVYGICRDVGEDERLVQGEWKHQRVTEGFSRSSPEYLGWLREQASEVLGEGTTGCGDGPNPNAGANAASASSSTSPSGEFRALIEHIAAEFGGVASVAPVKGYKRTVQKAQEKYGGDYSRMLDLARGMVVFDSIEQLAGALDCIKSRHDKQLEAAQICEDDDGRGGQRTGVAPPLPLLVRAKDRLSPRFDASRHTGGYRDVLLNLCLPTPSGGGGHVAELQLHLAPFLDWKNRRGHAVYEEARSVHMFNEAFTQRSYRWTSESDEDDVRDLLEDIRSGTLSSIDLDYSEALWKDDVQSTLADAFLDRRCNLRDISLRSCRCGDDFLVKCLPLEHDELWSHDHDHNPQLASVVRLGSKIHEGTAGRISPLGIGRLLRYLNGSLRVLDLEGCLDLEWYENCGDDVAATIERHADEMRIRDVAPLPQLRELNLRSTGLTPGGMATLDKLRERGVLGREVNILIDNTLRVGPPRRMNSRRASLASLRKSVCDAQLL